MKRIQQFGGDWTEQKLERLRKYLHEYMKIFSKNPKAQWFETIYVDAFAGTGYRTTRKDIRADQVIISELTGDEAGQFLKGSARIALDIDPSFKRYIFVERDSEHVGELESLKKQFPQKTIDIVQQDANAFLPQWCRDTDWLKCRAVVFLDPYGMEVEWNTIEAIAQTKAIDLWLLFPLGVAVNRLLTRNEPPSGSWAERLTKIFGTDEWKKAFYTKRREETLFGDMEKTVKEADFDAIGKFFVKRLKTVFSAVAEHPLPLRNSRNVPLYLLCFAAGNTKGANTALKIAQHLLKED